MPPLAPPRRVPLPWLLVALYLPLAALYALVTPPFEKPDESWHFAYSMYVAETGALPVQRLDGRDHLAEQEGSQPPLYYLLHAGLIRLAGLAGLSEGFVAMTVVNPFYPARPDWNANQYLHEPCAGAPCAAVRRALWLGRALSMLGGVAAILAAGWALRLAFPVHEALRIGTLGLMAVTPQFLHVSSAVSNDALTAATVTLTIALALRATRADEPWRWVAAAGVVAALAALTKTSGLSVLPVAALVLALGLRATPRRALIALLLFGGSWLLVLAPWFLRNLALYGEPTATAIHLQVYGVAAPALTPARFLAEWESVANSFWAAFGWGGIVLPQAVYRLAALLAALLGALGLVQIGRAWRSWSSPARLLALAALAQGAITLLLLARWMRLTVAPLGRLLFPAYFPLLLLLTLGFLALVPRRWQRRAVGSAVLLGAAGAVLLALGLVRPAYLPAPTVAVLPPGSRVIEAEAAPGVELLGVLLPPTAQAGGTLPVTLYWRSERPIEARAILSLALVGAEGDERLRMNSYPDGGRRPTTAWPTGEIVVDRQLLDLPRDLDPGALRVVASLFVADPTTDAGVRPLGDDWWSVELGAVEVQR